MLLENFYQSLQQALLGGKQTVVGNDGTSTLLDSTKFHNGTSIVDIRSFISRLQAAGIGGIAMGNGTTPPKLSDYTLSGQVVDHLLTVGSIVTTSETKDDGSVSFTSVLTLINNTDTDITVSEVALRNIATVSGGSWRLFIDRTLLDYPVTIAANGGVGKVTYTISLGSLVPAATA